MLCVEKDGLPAGVSLQMPPQIPFLLGAPQTPGGRTATDEVMGSDVNHSGQATRTSN